MMHIYSTLTKTAFSSLPSAVHVECATGNERRDGVVLFRKSNQISSQRQEQQKFWKIMLAFVVGALILYKYYRFQLW